jgi:response regulator NasT
MLIVCGQRELSEYLSGIITAAVPGRHTVALSGADARRRTSLSEFSAILIAGRLSDGLGLDLALDLAHGGCTGIMVVTERSELFDAHELLDGTGVTILSKPLTKDALLQAIKLILKVGESGGTVEKAKLMLMQHKNYTEPQAHRYIQKLSMDKRLPREVAAQYVIKAIERELSGNK